MTFSIETYYHNQQIDKLGRMDYAEIEGSKNAIKVFLHRLEHNAGIKRLILSSENEKIQGVTFEGNENETVVYVKNHDKILNNLKKWK